MRQDWVEFITDKEAEKCNTVCLRPEYILAIQDRANKGTRLTYDCNSETGSIDVVEPYEQVKQKIMDAEKVEHSKAIERFTRDEYRLILDLVGGDTSFSDVCRDLPTLRANLENKLNKILKEGNE